MCKERIEECQDLIASLVTICKMSLFFFAGEPKSKQDYKAC